MCSKGWLFISADHTPEYTLRTTCVHNKIDRVFVCVHVITIYYMCILVFAYIEQGARAVAGDLGSIEFASIKIFKQTQHHSIASCMLVYTLLHITLINAAKICTQKTVCPPSNGRVQATVDWRVS